MGQPFVNLPGHAKKPRKGKERAPRPTPDERLFPGKSPEPAFRNMGYVLTDEQLERAAVLEFEYGMSRQEADKAAAQGR